MRTSWLIVPATVLALVAASATRAGYVVTSFGPSVYDPNPAVMNAALGIDGAFAVENFEDTTLVANLSYTVAGTTFTALPRVFSKTEVLIGQQFWINDPWDGDHMLINNVGNDTGPNNWTTVRFNLDGPGASAFGVGISNLQTNFTTNARLLINGQDFGLVSGYAGFQSGLGRNVYLRIDAGSGDPAITSVTIQASNVEDSITFDHLAFRPAGLAAVPEPGSVALLAAGVAGLVGYRWRRSRR